MTTAIAAVAGHPSPLHNSFASLVSAALVAAGKDRSVDWQSSESADHAWIYLTHRQAVPRSDGWKLHVSAGRANAEAVLQRVLSVLLPETASFKIAPSLEALDLLNQGRKGQSQIGKFITIYPNDDGQAVRLALVLDHATQGLNGPAIPSDRPVRLGSLVQYRYGTFSPRYMQTLLGETVSALQAPDGSFIPDRRETRFTPPDWAEDPFVAAGVAGALPPPRLLIGERFLIVGTIAVAARGAVYMALDLEEPKNCVLKMARRNATIGGDGSDACDRLRREAAMMQRLAAHVQVPQVLALVEQEGDLYLALEDVAGHTLADHTRTLALQGRSVGIDDLITWSRTVAQTLQRIHDAGFIYCDLKGSNIILTPDRQVRLIDFEYVHEVTAEPGAGYGGTRGYLSPQQRAGMLPTVADTVYALGAVLYSLATGIEPAEAPDAQALFARPVALVNPSLGTQLDSIIARCLDPHSQERFPSLQALDGALAAVGGTLTALVAPFGGELAPEPEDQARTRYHDLARRLGDTLCAKAERQPEGGLAWVSSHSMSWGARARDINTGCAGAVLALAKVAAACGVADHRQTLAQAAHWLGSAPRAVGPILPGLYVGEAGVGAALLAAGQTLDDAAVIRQAAERGRMIATLPYRSPDLFNGAAGRLRFHLLLWDETEEPEHLDAARQAGDYLLTTAEDAGAGGLCWTLPAGYDDLSGHAYLGYAHGAAGIADALLDLYEACQDERYLAAVQGAGRWLTHHATPALDDDSGLTWPAHADESDLTEPANEDGAEQGPFWCHGATGIGRFFLHAAELNTVPDALEIACGAARFVARGARWAGPTQCHGLAGNIEFLLDMAQATGDGAYHGEARSLARLLEAFTREQDGVLVVSSEDPACFSPDYMVGYAGTAVCLVRLSDPDLHPHQLSRRGFRRHRIGRA